MCATAFYVQYTIVIAIKMCIQLNKFDAPLHKYASYDKLFAMHPSLSYLYSHFQQYIILAK